MCNMSSFIRCKFVDQQHWCLDNFFFANFLKVVTRILDKRSTVYRRYLSEGLSPLGSGRGDITVDANEFAPE